MYQILLVVAKIYFDSIATFDFINSGRVNKPRDIKGLFTIFTESALRPIQSVSRDVRPSSCPPVTP